MAIWAEKGLLQERVDSSELIQTLALTLALNRGTLEAGFPATETNKRAEHKSPTRPTHHPTHALTQYTNHNVRNTQYTHTPYYACPMPHTHPHTMYSVHATECIHCDANRT